jgi:hypothetical protein
MTETEGMDSKQKRQKTQSSLITSSSSSSEVPSLWSAVPGYEHLALQIPVYTSSLLLDIDRYLVDHVSPDRYPSLSEKHMKQKSRSDNGIQEDKILFGKVFFIYGLPWKVKSEYFHSIFFIRFNESCFFIAFDRLKSISHVAFYSMEVM